MSIQANSSRAAPGRTLRIRLTRNAGYPDFVHLLNKLEARERYRVFLDASAVFHLGTTEFRVLGSFAERFEQHGGFLRLEKAGEELAALFRSFGCAYLLAEAGEGASSTRAATVPPARI